jgi:hypothetical protein
MEQDKCSKTVRNTMFHTWPQTERPGPHYWFSFGINPTTCPTSARDISLGIKQSECKDNHSHASDPYIKVRIRENATAALLPLPVQGAGDSQVFRDNRYPIYITYRNILHE